MIKIEPADISKIISRNGQLFVPPIIDSAITKCIEHANEVEIIENRGTELIAEYEPLDSIIEGIDYDDPLTIDAYTLYYLRRNIFIPRIALYELTMNPIFQKLHKHIRVLDLGTGTGAVVLSLLEMFQHFPLNDIKLTIDAVDISGNSLRRLKNIIQSAKLPLEAVNLLQADIKNTVELKKILNGRGAYDLVFAANVFIEIELRIVVDILNFIADKLSNKAAIIIVNPNKNITKRLQPQIGRHARMNGLYVYYPCPPDKECVSSECWFWRNEEYRYSNLKIGGKLLLSSHREEIAAHWLVLSNVECSIYDLFKDRRPDLEWGVLSIYGQDSRLCDCQLCSDKGVRPIGKQDKICKRGAVVGGTGEPFQIQEVVGFDYFS